MRWLFPTCLLLVPAGCDSETPQEPGVEPPKTTNRIALSPEIIGNLGITFAEVTRGRLEHTLDVPGRLIVPDDRHWMVRTPSAGRIALRVERWATVERGDVVAELSTPALLELQRALFAALSEGEEAQAQLQAMRAEEPALRAQAGTLVAAVAAARRRTAESEHMAASALEVAEAAAARIEELERIDDVDALSRRELLEARRIHAEEREDALAAAIQRDDLAVRLADLELRSARARAHLETHAAEITVLERRAQSARLAFARQLHELAALTAYREDELTGPAGEGPLWQQLESVEMRAPGNGSVVDLLAAGGEWLENGQSVLEIVDASELLFRGQLPESDLGRIPADAPTVVVPSAEGWPPIESRLRGPLPVADEVARTIRILAPVPNVDGRLPAGLSAVARVLLRTSQHDEVLAPSDGVVRDGLEWVAFRRDPEEPSTVTRIPVELGERAGDRVEVLSGLLAGDEIVRNGIHQLVHSGLGRAPPGGHFHADGSWHEDHK